MVARGGRACQRFSERISSLAKILKICFHGSKAVRKAVNGDARGELVSESVQDRLRAAFPSLTRAERQLAATITENYPVSGMGTITILARAAGVSTPTVARMVQKLGFKGFPEFQEALREELRAQMTSPLEKHEAWSRGAPAGHMLNRFTDIALENIRQTLAQVDPAEFDAATALLSDLERQIFVTGGRITRTLSTYLEMHLQVMRPGVRHVQGNASGWSHALLDMGEGDVLVIYDIRRYQKALLTLSEMARARGVRIVLFTDQWLSPIHPLADHGFAARIEAPSAWDSSTALLLLTETVIAAVQEVLWDEVTRERMADLERIFDHTPVFRKLP
ncbi:MAG: MurR/RpiR family transcriptional regulator [Alphaproteobacteria bacterium]|nr:MAG: MurR/RpiR family transcriptional regulator [Alphaproteobacteria bacterium]